MRIDIPGFRSLQLAHLVLDYNGTIAVDGQLVKGVADDLTILAEDLTVHVITADTFGLAARNLAAVPCKLSILSGQRQEEAKRRYVEQLGCEVVAAIGNGRNDRLMLRAAALGVAVILQEGAAAETIAAADVVCTDIRCALQLLMKPLRLTATLRS